MKILKHHGSEQPDFETYNHSFPHEVGSECMSEQMYELNGANKQSKQCVENE